MTPLRLIGVALLLAGAVILAMDGVSYTKNRQTVSAGPIAVSTEQKGFISPIVGLAFAIIGIALVSPRHKKS